GSGRHERLRGLEKRRTRLEGLTLSSGAKGHRFESCIARTLMGSRLLEFHTGDFGPFGVSNPAGPTSSGTCRVSPQGPTPLLRRPGVSASGGPHRRPLPPPQAPLHPDGPAGPSPGRNCSAGPSAPTSSIAHAV